MSDEEASASSAEGVNRFWGAHVSAAKPSTLTLTSSELRVTQACLAKDTKSGGHATLVVKSGIVDDGVSVCTLRHGGTEFAALNLEFFTDDGAVEFSVVGNATIDLTGECPARAALLPFPHLQSYVCVSLSLPRCGDAGPLQPGGW